MVCIYRGQNRSALVSTANSGLHLSAYHDIPQVDVSMHLPSYRGSKLPLVGCVSLCTENPQADSPRKPCLFLFQAYSPEEFQELAVWLQSIIAEEIRAVLEDKYALSQGEADEVATKALNTMKETSLVAVSKLVRTVSLEGLS